ncbi:hypothetical protein CUPS3785_08965 [Campylobacter upsaliensis]|uniref:hypothetical protein n=1 Tax=Campylobacter upsaliensis TaxID=28080 RepID=UPI00214A237A|nr:hypothetical protein [Campylobacter upsaliensis]MCR2123195.1 hypothetical protein [Campylobacter upsaliensis]MCR2125233.1 hypothetical protein [Campylobacter upsaliensis]
MFFSPRSKAPLKEPKPKGTTRPNPADLPKSRLNLAKAQSVPKAYAFALLSLKFTFQAYFKSCVTKQFSPSEKNPSGF